MNLKIATIQQKLFKPTSVLLLISLAAHIGLILLIVLAAKDKPFINDRHNDKQTTATLKSYLLIPKLSSKLQAPLENEKGLIVSKPTRQTVQEKLNVENDMKKQAKEAQTSIVRNSETDSQIIPIDQITLDKVSLNKPLPEKISTNNPSTQIMSSIDQKYGALVTKHLTNYNARYSQTQAQKYRTLKSSPVIDTANAINTTDIVMKPALVSVDCSSTSSQVIAVISGLMNGTVKCRGNNNFQLYIDQRLNPVAIKVLKPAMITNKAALKPIDYAEDGSSEVVN